MDTDVKKGTFSIQTESLNCKRNKKIIIAATCINNPESYKLNACAANSFKYKSINMQQLLFQTYLLSFRVRFAKKESSRDQNGICKV